MSEIFVSENDGKPSLDYVQPFMESASPGIQTQPPENCNRDEDSLLMEKNSEEKNRSLMMGRKEIMDFIAETISQNEKNNIALPPLPPPPLLLPPPPPPPALPLPPPPPPPSPRMMDSRVRSDERISKNKKEDTFVHSEERVSKNRKMDISVWSKKRMSKNKKMDTNVWSEERMSKNKNRHAPPPMKRARLQNDDGEDPYEGMIFMSNGATRKECVAKQLFGLPNSHMATVERVKPGMKLFLFEYERRKLYGVFEATTKGRHNIDPRAFRGGFPAQVRVKTVWKCYPLTEDEFRGAIIDNYFSSNKFNFYLSQEQVLSLIKLFSTKEVNSLAPRRLPNASGEVKDLREKLNKKRKATSDTGDRLAGTESGQVQIPKKINAGYFHDQKNATEEHNRTENEEASAPVQPLYKQAFEASSRSKSQDVSIPAQPLNLGTVNAEFEASSKTKSQDVSVQSKPPHVGQMSAACEASSMQFPPVVCMPPGVRMLYVDHPSFVTMPVVQAPISTNVHVSTRYLQTHEENSRNAAIHNGNLGIHSYSLNTPSSLSSSSNSGSFTHLKPYSQHSGSRESESILLFSEERELTNVDNCSILSEESEGFQCISEEKEISFKRRSDVSNTKKEQKQDGKSRRRKIVRPALSVQLNMEISCKNSSNSNKELANATENINEHSRTEKIDMPEATDAMNNAAVMQLHDSSFDSNKEQENVIESSNRPAHVERREHDESKAPNGSATNADATGQVGNEDLSLSAVRESDSFSSLAELPQYDSIETNSSASTADQVLDGVPDDKSSHLRSGTGTSDSFKEQHISIDCSEIPGIVLDDCKEASESQQSTTQLKLLKEDNVSLSSPREVENDDASKCSPSVDEQPHPDTNSAINERLHLDESNSVTVVEENTN